MIALFFKLLKNEYEILVKNALEIKQYFLSVKEEKEYVQIEISKNDVQEVQLLINDEIVLNGMNEQEEVNDLGRNLYKIYDEFLYQKNHQ